MQSFCWKVRRQPLGVPLNIICFLSLAAFNILCLSWIFAILIKISLDVPVEDTLCFLRPDVYLLSQIKEVFRYCLQIFSPCPFLSHFTWDLYNVNVSMLETSQWSLKLSSFLLTLFFPIQLQRDPLLCLPAHQSFPLYHVIYYWFFLGFIFQFHVSYYLSLCGSLYFLTPCW